MIQTLHAETREYKRDHYNTFVWALLPRCINDICYSDIFFSTVCSVRGFICFQMFAFKCSKYDVIKLMCREAMAPDAYLDIIPEHGVPNETITGNVQVLTGTRWTNINRQYCIATGLTVPHHQHQTYSEGQGGNFEFGLQKLLHNMPYALDTYWCFAAMFVDKARCFLSKASLNGWCGNEMITGETGNFSIFCFYWFEPIWYYEPRVSFLLTRWSHTSS